MPAPLSSNLDPAAWLPLVIPPSAGFSSVTGRCPLSPSSRPRIPPTPLITHQRPALHCSQGAAQCQEKERKFSPDLDGRSTGATLAGRNLVWSWTPILRRSLHHQEHDQRHQSPHYRWHSYHCSHFRSAPVELSHGSCIAPATRTCLRGIVRSRMVGANSFTRHTGNSSRQL